MYVYCVCSLRVVLSCLEKAIGPGRDVGRWSGAPGQWNALSPSNGKLSELIHYSAPLTCYACILKPIRKEKKIGQEKHISVHEHELPIYFAPTLQFLTVCLVLWLKSTFLARIKIHFYLK